MVAWPEGVARLTGFWAGTPSEADRIPAQMAG